MPKSWIRFPIAAPIGVALALSLLVACGGDDDGGTLRPPATHKTVFLSSASYDGNLGGQTGADAKCQSLANAAQLDGTYRAWIGDSIASVESRMAKSNLPYRLVDGTQVADNFDDLADESVDHALNMDENGVTQGNYEVWTGSAFAHCGNWTTNSGDWQAVVGLSGTTDWRWVSVYNQFCDRDNVKLYCIEQ